MRNRGFTLLELLVAMVVTSLLIALLSYSLQSIAGVTSKSSGRLEAEREARAAMEFLERDLKAAISNAGGRERPHVIQDPDMPSSHWLVFFSLPLDHSTDEPGDVCLMSYRVGNVEPQSGMGDVPALYRYRMPSDQTFDEFLDDDVIDYASLEAASVNYTNWLASGIVGLDVKAWIGGEVVEIVDFSNQNSSAWEALEVTLEVLTTTGRMQYGARPLADLKREFGHRFTRRIALTHPTP